MLKYFDEEAAEKRMGQILELITPHMDEINQLISAHHSIVINIPEDVHPLHPDELREAREEPFAFRRAILSDALFRIAIAEQQTGVTYPDQDIPEKVISDINAKIAEMAAIERGARSGRLTH